MDSNISVFVDLILYGFGFLAFAISVVLVISKSER